MGILLFFLSFSLLVFFISKVNKDFANPGFLYLGVWLIATFSSLFIIKEGDISFKTVLVVILGNLLFVLGILFSQYFVVTHSKKIVIDEIYIPVWLTILLFLFILWGLNYIYRDLLNVSRIVEPSISFNKVLEGARYASTRSLGRISYTSATLLRIYYALGVVYFYYFCKSLFYTQRSNLYRYTLLGMSLLLLGSSILSTGRSELLGMVAAYLTLLLLFYSKCYAWENIKYRGKLLKIIIYAGFIFLGLFLIIGVFLLNRTGKNQGESLFDNLFKYLGSSIGGLDYFLNNRSLYGVSKSFGQNTFLSLYSTLTSLGIYTGTREVFLPTVNISGILTNVYTIYYYFIQDFGYFIGILIQFLYGSIFGYFYYFIKKRHFSKYFLIIYSLISQALIMSFFAEQFFSVLTNHIVRIGFAIVFLVIISISNLIKWKK